MFYFNFSIFCSIIFLSHLINNVASLQSEKIFGGDEFKKGNENFAPISLFANAEDGKPKSICTGSLISDSFALTAAHCFFVDNVFDTEPYFVLVNTVNLTNYDKRNKIYVKKVYVPTVYRQLKYGLSINDIAVMELRSKVRKINRMPIVTLKLPEGNSNFANQVGILYGYGKTKYVDTNDPKTGKIIKTEASDSILKYLKVQIEAVENCSQEKLYPSLFCGTALQTSPGENRAAYGDSGGPLVIGDTVVAVLSTLQFNADVPTKGAYYTKVSSFIGFINSIKEGRIISHITNTYNIQCPKSGCCI